MKNPGVNRGGDRVLCEGYLYELYTIINAFFQ
jgi:hypothetical protein